jgi:RimJ/RimL family protein N-acetyltransferase
MLKCDEENIFWTGHAKKPDKDILKKWFLNQLERNDRIMFIVKDSETDAAIGYLYLDIVGDNDTIETGHGVNSNYKGRGIGTKIIKFALEYTRNHLKYINEVHGWILEDNVGSIKNVLNNGYKETEDTKEVFIEGFDGYKKMKKYIYKNSDTDKLLI